MEHRPHQQESPARLAGADRPAERVEAVDVPGPHGWDVELLESQRAAAAALNDAALREGTAAAPTFVPLESPLDSSAVRGVDLQREAQERVGDFEILRVLGRGAFGVVYLARQLSLDRHVALKVTATLGDEGRTMARLEHEHIVQVFSETVDADAGLRYLCMQYVPGTTLQAVIQGLRLRGTAWTGRDYLQVIDDLHREPTALDAAALRDRQMLEQCDRVETVCWMGARLAEALGHAHGQGVLHRDIKPGNILVSRYGRPLLVDFNLALPSVSAGPGDELFGGTLAYMAPEHLAAFRNGSLEERDRVREQADTYSLGVAVFELATGRLPPETTRQAGLTRDAWPPPASSPSPWAGERERSLYRTLRRCLAVRPEERFATAGELAAEFDGSRQRHQALGEMPSLGRFGSIMLRHPWLSLILAGVLPNQLAGAVNIAYNHARIVSDLSPAQDRLFQRLVIGFNPVAYALCVAFVLWVLLPTFRTWRRLGQESADDDEVTAARRRVLTIPQLAVALIGGAWTLGAFFFPFGLHVFSEPLPRSVFVHFGVSFVISGLIAVAYSYLLVQCLIVVVIYPKLWGRVGGFTRTAAEELRPIMPRVRSFQALAGLIPLSGAVLALSIGPQSFTLGEFRWFQLLAIGLIIVGMVGVQMAAAISGLLHRSLQVLAGK